MDSPGNAAGRPTANRSPESFGSVEQGSPAQIPGGAAFKVASIGNVAFEDEGRDRHDQYRHAEESAAAAEELNAQAEQMKIYVGDLVKVVGGAGRAAGSRANGGGLPGGRFHPQNTPFQNNISAVIRSICTISF